MSVSEVVITQEGVADFVLVAGEPLQVYKNVVINEVACMFAGDLVFEPNLDVNLVLLTEVGPCSHPLAVVLLVIVSTQDRCGRVPSSKSTQIPTLAAMHSRKMMVAQHWICGRIRKH